MLLSRRFSNLRRSNCRAFSLTELAVVLGIIGIILGAIWVAGGAVQLNNQTQAAAADTALIVSGYRTLYGPRGVDTTALQDITCIGVTNGYFPASMSTGACVLNNTATYPHHPYGGYVQVRGDLTNQGIQVGLFELSETACNRYAASFAKNPELISETISGATVTPSTVTVSAIANECDSGGGNSVVLTFKAR